MNKLDEIRERAKEEGNGIFRKSSVLVLLDEIDRLNEEVADLRRRNIDLESIIADLLRDLNQKNLDVFGGE